MTTVPETFEASAPTEADRRDPADRLVLTDVELAVLCGPEPFAVEPFLAVVPPESRDAVLATAYAGLVARGLVRPTTTAAGTGEGEGVEDGVATAEVREDLLAVVAVRTDPRVAVALARTTGAGQDYRYTYLSAQLEEVALVEEVATTGLHRFDWAPADRHATDVAAACLHPGATDGTGAKVLLTGGVDDPRPPDELAAALGASYVHAAVVVRDRGDQPPVTLSMFSGPGGCWLARYDKTASRWWAVPGPVDTLRRYVERTVGEAVAAAAAVPAPA